jgi:hypothetical protein
MTEEARASAGHEVGVAMAWPLFQGPSVKEIRLLASVTQITPASVRGFNTPLLAQ